MPIDMRGLCPLIQVFDMPTSVRFYRDVLGFEIVGHAPLRGPDEFGWCWLRLGETELMLNTAYDYGERPAAPDPARVAAHGDTCNYIGARMWMLLINFCAAKGLDVKKPHVTHYGMKQLYLADLTGLGFVFSGGLCRRKFPGPIPMCEICGFPCPKDGTWGTQSFFGDQKMAVT